MKRYGLRIGDVGVEFPSREERQKALVDFTGGACVKISDSGIRFSDGKDAFSTYERDDKEVLANCIKCQGVFGIDACPSREFPKKESWNKDFRDQTGSICDACFEVQRKAKELFDAKKVVAKNESEL